MKKFILVAFLIIFSVLIVACNDEEKESETEKAENETQTEAEEEAPQVEFSDEERVDADEPVLKVNGKEVKGDQYNRIYTQTKTLMFQYGQDVSDLDVVKDQVVSILTEQELINQDAEERGIEVTEEEAQEELGKLKEASKEQFNQMLETYQITEDELKEQLVDDLVINEYIEKEFEAKVSDEEIEDYYNQLKEQSEDLPELDEAMKGEIEGLLKTQKQSEQLAERVAELREDAEIEQLI